MVIDTNILIYYLQREPKIVNQLNLWYENNISLFISVISITEILAYPKLDNIKIDIIKDFLQRFVKIEVNENTAERAGELKRTYNLEIGDALIGATALLLDQPLITRNLKDFRKIKGLEVIGL